MCDFFLHFRTPLYALNGNWGVYLCRRGKVASLLNPLETLGVSYCSTDSVSPDPRTKGIPNLYPRSTWGRVLSYMHLRRILRPLLFCWINNSLEIEDGIVLWFQLLIHVLLLLDKRWTHLWNIKGSRTFDCDVSCSYRTHLKRDPAGSDSTYSPKYLTTWWY